MGMSWLDVQLGLRMLLRYKGLTIAGGLALAIAMGLGAGWYDVMRDQLRPTLPLPDGDRLVEIEMRNTAASAGEFRLLHDFTNWRKEVRTIEDLGAYRTLERNLFAGGGPPQTVNVAQITASAFRVARVPPLLGRPLMDSDEQPGAPPVVVLGYSVWQQRFFGRPDVVGQTVQLGRDHTTVVGVMPEGFAFPVNQTIWTALQLQASGYAPLEGPAINRVFGRLAPGVGVTEAAAEISALTARVAAASPATHEHLRASVHAYGAEDLGGSWIDFLVTHAPVLLILVVACANVGTLVYARTATREAEIAMRHALGASRSRIVAQLFVEALVLAAIAAVVGLVAADLVLRWGYEYLAREQALPFWIQPGLKFATTIYAALMALVAAGILGALPAIKATGSTAAQLRNMGVGGATLRFGKVWTTAMIAQVAITVICIVPAKGISEEAVRDRIIRSRFPAAQYLAVEFDVDREPAPERDVAPDAAVPSAQHAAQLYQEFERLVTEEPGVRAVAFGDRLPGMDLRFRTGQVELASGADPTDPRTLWMASVGPGYFELFDRPIVAGRDFHNGDRVPEARNVIVNEAFARRYTKGASPVGVRVRYEARDRTKPEPWFEVVGMVRDIGMTPTDLGEAPYVYHAASAATESSVVMGIRVTGDPAPLVPRVREIAADLDARVRLGLVQPLDDVVWSQDAPNLAASGVLVAIVALGLFLSAAGIFSLMSVSVARRTREIGLRSALGASQLRVVAGIFSRALVLIGSGIVAGNSLIVLVAFASEEVGFAFVARELAITSAVMLTVGLMGCIEPARRALRINPTEALKEA